MAHYQIYHLDGAGWVKRVESLDADGDDCAIAAAAFDVSFAQCEVWQGRRLVTRLESGLAIGEAQPSADEPVRAVHPH